MFKNKTNQSLKNTVERLEVENEALRSECHFLRKMIDDERNFFLRVLKYNSVEEYRKVRRMNLDHAKKSCSVQP
ncbi:hypothetical protein E5983_00715 [Streptococcus danieliae]|uniref:Transposase n=1 Tax=Streptococcus danieliae TaxID=747656 RepID=A0A7X3KB34_9STRE|nr:hypothetical protein [Streptococcus danieliae]MVX58196.1 hypothetical protein [Streptococcus danieliae]